MLLCITSGGSTSCRAPMWAGINENVDPTIAAVATVLMLATLGGLLIQRGFRLRAAHSGHEA